MVGIRKRYCKPCAIFWAMEQHIPDLDSNVIFRIKCECCGVVEIDGDANPTRTICRHGMAPRSELA